MDLLDEGNNDKIPECLQDKESSALINRDFQPNIQLTSLNAAEYCEDVG